MPLCSLFLEELKTNNGANGNTMLDPCYVCGEAIGRHPRAPPAIPAPIINPAPIIPPNHGNNGVIRDVIKSLPTWRTDFQFCRPFLQRVAQILTSGNIPEAEWPRLLLLCVKDVQESEWIRSNILTTANLTWQITCDLFTSHFELHSYKDKLERDYEQCSQRKNETVQHYGDRFLDLCTQLSIADNDTSAIRHFSAGLHRDIENKYKEQIRMMQTFNLPNVNVTSLKRLLDIVIALDMKVGGSPASPSTEQRQSTTTGQSSKQCKYHPNSTTHSTSECRNKPNQQASSQNASSSGTASSSSASPQIKCFGCGGIGHYANDKNCPKRQQRSGSSSTTTVKTEAKTTASSSGASAQNSSTIRNRAVHVADDCDSDTCDHKDENDVAVRVSTIDRTFSAIDRTLPASIIVPTKQSIMIQFNDKLYSTLIDSGADASIIDHELVKQLCLPINTVGVTGNIDLAHPGHSVPRIGKTTIPIVCYFTGSDRACVKLDYTFEVFPVYSTRHDYHFIIGTDLIHILFGEHQSLPLSFIPKPAVAKQVSAISVAGECDVICLRNISVDKSTTLLQDLVDLQTMVHESGAGDLPPDETPERLALSTDISMLAEYEIKRTSLLADDNLQHVLSINADITGFCNLPESIVQLHIDPALEHKCYRRQYPIAQSLKELADPVIQRWFDTGKICLAPPNCRFNNPITIAPKKDDTGKMTGIRVCLDTRAVNAALIADDRFQLPYIRSALEVLGGNCIFGEFDLAEAYLQFMLHEDSRPYTAFTWNNQQYMFIGCPFGLSPLPSIYQRIMTRIFYDLPFTFPYIDNLPFGSSSWSQHLEHGIAIIDRLNQVNLKVKHNAYNIGHSQIRCLGHMVSSAGIGIDPDKLQAIRDWSLPQTGEQLMSFLGFVTFIRDHIRHVAELTGPLEAVKFSKVIDWTPELVEHFNATKAAVMKAPFLHFPDFSRAFHIATDASNTGIGGVLYQPSKPGEHITAGNIVAICSKKLSACQQRYPAYKKELFGVVYSLRHFHAYVWGRNDLVIVTDHKPLTYIMSSVQLAPALQQWLDVILDYQFEIVHRDGILHVVPDALSRMFSSFYDGSTHWGAPSSAGASFTDVVGSPPDGFITGSFPVAKPAVTPKHIKVAVTSFEKREGCDDESSSHETITSTDPVKVAIELERRGKVMPTELADRTKLISDAHAFGHFGREAIFRKLWHQGYWWPNIRGDIENELKSCEACLRFVVVKSGYHPFKSIIATAPGDHVQIDTSVHLPATKDGYTALLVIIDVFTGFVLLRPLKSTGAEEVARNLWEVFCIIGLPKILQSDNGREFVNEILRALVKLTGIEQRLISPYNPRADGKVERAIGSVVLIIKKLLFGYKENWSLFVPFAQLSFNDKVATLTGSSPFALMFGRSLNPIKDYTKDADKPVAISYDADSKLWKEHQEKIVSLIYPAINERVRGAKDALVKRLNANRRQLLPTAIPNGAVVMLRDPILQSKFEPKYVGPYSIIRRARNGAYVLRDATGDILDRHVPADQLKIVSKKPRAGDKNNVYVVSKIVDHRGTAGNYEYLISWEGYKEKTWEPEANILTPETIKAYWSSVNATQLSSSSS